MNWDDMSDDQINERVAHTEHDGITLPDYCNSPDDAWPIIASNNISVINIKDTTMWMACSDSDFENVCMSPDGSDNGVTCHFSKNEVFSVGPLRAAMIVFLKMKEAQS